MTISKELLSEVLGFKVEYLITDLKEIHNSINSSIKENNIAVYHNGEWDYINIYELAHLCKVWALQKNIKMWSIVDSENSCICRMNSLQKDEFYAETEYEAVIKMCQWILDNAK